MDDDATMPRLLPSESALYQFARFAVVGMVGFVVTTSLIYLTRGLLGPALAGIPAFFAAVTVSWVLNRSWTFKYTGREPLFYQWLHYLVWTSPTVITNFIVYELVIFTFPLAHTHPIVATSAGAISGMLISFTVMRLIVFKPNADALRL